MMKHMLYDSIYVMVQSEQIYSNIFTSHQSRLLVYPGCLLMGTVPFFGFFECNFKFLHLLVFFPQAKQQLAHSQFQLKFQVLFGAFHGFAPTLRHHRHIQYTGEKVFIRKTMSRSKNTGALCY